MSAQQVRRSLTPYGQENGAPKDQAIQGIESPAPQVDRGDDSRKETALKQVSTRTLYSYQQRAATFFYERDAAFLVAPLGAGKGAAALTALADLVRDGERRHALVIAPKLVAATVWPREVTLWPHLAHLRVAVLNGTPERRRELLAAAPARAVTAIGIDLVPWLVGELAGLADDHPLLDVLIIDETSRLKDPSGKRARTLLKIAGRFRTRWGLTRGSRLWIWRRH